MRARATFMLVAIAGASAVIGIAAPALGGGNNGTVCPTNVGPDVIVGDIVSLPANYTAEQIPAGSGNWYDAFSFGTTSCNIGNMNVSWQQFSSNLHPCIGQGLYKVKDGRIEQLGISWLKHGFTALTGNVCGCGCSGQGGSVLGVGCSDPYTASRNGAQTGNTIGPRYQVNATTGFFPPGGPANPPMEGSSTARRLRVKSSDLEPSSATVLYFVECQYVTQDDANWGNKFNNCSYRQLAITGGPNEYNVSNPLLGSTTRQLAGIHAWKKTDPTIVETDIDIANDGGSTLVGRFILAAKATDLGGGQWHYEYALQNQNSDRSGQAFSVPLPAGANVTNIGFHDIQYSSNDGTPNPGVQNFDGTDWTPVNDGSSLKWSTDTFANNTNANALRFGTMYNFRFDCDRPPQSGQITLSTFKVVGDVNANTIVPAPDCNGNNVADATDITNGTSQDANVNGIPDECEKPPPVCDSDINNDNVVNSGDLLAVINAWGPCSGCPEDINADGFVNSGDLLAVINAWGPCPTP